MRKRGRWTKYLFCAVPVGAVLAGVFAVSASATITTVLVGNLKVTFGGAPSPRALPKEKLAPVALELSGKVQTTDGTHPSALREAIVEETDVAVNAKGVPVCRRSQLVARNTEAAKRVCGQAIVGRGSAHAEIAFPEQKPIRVPSPLLIFNGGTEHGKTTMYIHGFITAPVPAAVVTTITIQKLSNGLYAVVKIPAITGGSGSVLDFQVTVGKKEFTYKDHRHTYWEAKCPDGHFTPKLVKAVFKNEAKIEGVAPETVLSDRLVVPCTPKG